MRFLTFLALALAGCSSSEKPVLLVYSPHGKEMLSEFEEAFEAQHPAVDVRWLDMGSQDVYDRVRTERYNPQADVWWGAPSLTFMRAETEGLLERYVPAWDGSVSADSKSPNGYWYGTFVTPEVIMYNNKVLAESEVPRDWDDLLDPRWSNKIIIRYPLASGTMRIIFCALIQREESRSGSLDAAFAWLSRLDANTKSYASDPTQLYLKIAREEGLLSLWNLPDVVTQVDVNGYPFGYLIPASGTPLITDCIAIIKGTRRLEDAKRFYEFVTSKESLIRQAREFYRIPARNDIATSELPEWIGKLQIRPMKADWASIAKNEKEWMRRWEERVRGSRMKN